MSVRVLHRMGILDAAHVRVRGEDLTVPVDTLALGGLRLLLVNVTVKGFAGGLCASEELRKSHGQCLAPESRDEQSAFLCTTRVQCERQARVELLDTVPLNAFRLSLDMLLGAMCGVEATT